MANVLFEFIKNDLHRMDEYENKRCLFWRVYISKPGFRYLMTYRICKYIRSRAILKHTLFYLYRTILHFQSVRFNIDIPLSMEIGPGFRVDHFGGIWLSQKTVIGRNCSISGNVAFGFIPRGINEGVPVSIGDNVYIGPGAKLLGKISVGNNVVIGANSVVTKSIPDNVTVFGVPARIVSHEGSDGYINNKV